MTSDPSLMYREFAGQNASPIRLVILLYEQLAKDLQRAAAALEKKQIELRTQEIDHALLVVGHLQASLDKERGGDVARNLDQFYEVMRGSLIDAQISQSPNILRNQVRHVLALREAWVEVEHSNQLESASSAGSVVPTVLTADAQEGIPRTNWKA